MLKHLFKIKIASIDFAYGVQQKNLWAAQEMAFAMAKDMSAMGQSEAFVEPIVQAEARWLAQSRRRAVAGFFDDILLSGFIFLFWLLFGFFGASLMQANGLSLNELLASLLLGTFLLLIAHLFFTEGAQESASAASFLRDLKEAHEVAGPSRASEGRLVEGRVSHGFAQAKSMLLRDVDVAIERGKIYGLSGAPLSGKSTLLKIVGQKLKPTLGGLSWGGAEGPLKIGFIDNDSDVFLGTLKDNVSLWDAKKTESEIAQALSEARAEELFYKRPLGLLSPIYAHGRNISSGQRKRLMLARALLVKPELLVLDNFFEALEGALARAVLSNIKNLNIACIFSSYDANLLKMADEVIFLGERR